MNHSVKKLTYSALFLALTFILPFFTGQIPQIGSMLSPMHYPVMLCGFVCGGPWGLAVGFIAPILRSLLFGMPPMYPVAVAMAFEMGAYGLFCGLFYQLSANRMQGAARVYLSLILSMLLGRAVWGAAQFVLLAVSGGAFTFSAFLAGAFINAIPAIVCQLLLVPAIVLLIERTQKAPAL